MVIGIIGLGLIGGSLAKAFAAYTTHTIYGEDQNEEVVREALSGRVLAARLTPERLSECDLLFIALYPQATIDCLREAAPHLREDAVVMDCCGVKRAVCPACFSIARTYGFHFVGGHPMAGLHHSGYAHATRVLFRNAPLILVPLEEESAAVLTKLSLAAAEIGFAKTVLTTAEQHDRIIAYTSQLAHIVSSAYVKSPTAKEHAGYSAGSYKDMTRVARLNEGMWTELFLDNDEELLAELDRMIDHLVDYREALADRDADKLTELLREGRLRKQEIDG